MSTQPGFDWDDISQPGEAVAPEKRHTREHPCPICGGYEELPQGIGERCWGYNSKDGLVCFCTREEYAGVLNKTAGESGGYAHRLDRLCPCGEDHRTRVQAITQILPFASTDGGKPTLVTDTRRVIKTQRFRIEFPDGSLAGIHVREDWEETDAANTRTHGKSLYWRDHNGRKASEMPLYRANDLRDAKPGSRVVVTEGETCARALRKIGILAVATVTGAESTPRDEVLEALLPFDVCLWPDHDVPGRKHMERIAQRLWALGARSVSRVEWSEAPPKGDAADWMNDSRTPADLVALLVPWLLTQRGPFAGALVDEERYRVTLAETSDAVLLWAVFEPLCQTLFLPFLLRGSQEGTHTLDATRALWAEVDAVYEALRLEVAAETAVMRPRGGWSKLRAEDRRAAKLALSQALARQAPPDIGARLRAWRLQALLTQYYAKAKDGLATRKQVLTKAHQPTLVAYFGGDWLAFLDYLGEQPHPDEAIVTALPEPRVFVGETAKVYQVAADLGVSPAAVAEIASSLWQPGAGLSPIEERTRVLDHYWYVFDVIHARQAPGMPSLWGLADDEGPGPAISRALSTTMPSEVRGLTPGIEAYNPGLYRSLFPADLLQAIQRLWGHTVLPMYPERIVSEPYAHAALADTIGPALRFWHGCALTAWFLCEGPYSRTDMAGLAAYHARQLAALQDLGTPVHSSLFDELIAEQARLGPPEQIVMSRDTSPILAGRFSVTVSTYASGRRAGFERLRDIITRHRQGWSRVYWQPYLHSQWERELRQAGMWFNEAVARDGRQPTPRQLAKAALQPIRHWFGGDISLLYAAIGESSPIQPVADLRLPADPVVVATAMLRELYSAFPRVAAAARSVTRRGALPDPEVQHLVITFDQVAEQSLRYAQLWGALGHPPDVKEFGVAKLRAAAEALAIEPQALWERFSACAQRAIPPTS